MRRRQEARERGAPVEKTRQNEAKLWLCRKDKGQPIIERHIGRKEIISEAHMRAGDRTHRSLSEPQGPAGFITLTNTMPAFLSCGLLSARIQSFFFSVWSSLERKTSEVWDLVKSYIYYIQGWQSRHSRSEAQLCPDLGENLTFIRQALRKQKSYNQHLGSRINNYY